MSTFFLHILDFLNHAEIIVKQKMDFPPYKFDLKDSLIVVISYGVTNIQVKLFFNIGSK